MKPPLPLCRVFVTSPWYYRRAGPATWRPTATPEHTDNQTHQPTPRWPPHTPAASIVTCRCTDSGSRGNGRLVWKTAITDHGVTVLRPFLRWVSEPRGGTPRLSLGRYAPNGNAPKDHAGRSPQYAGTLRPFLGQAAPHHDTAVQLPERLYKKYRRRTSAMLPSIPVVPPSA